MKLTKDQRHTAYIIMLAEFESKEIQRKYNLRGSWFCYLIWHLFGIENSGFSVCDSWTNIADVMQYFPELKEHFDYSIDNEDYEARRKILNKCIKETYDF